MRSHQGYSNYLARLRDQKRPQPRQRPITGWLTPTLLNGWANFGDPYPPVQFHKSEDGKVYIRGAVSGGSAGTVIFLLPADYRPFHTERFICAGLDDPTTIEVTSEGEVKAI